MRGRVIKVIGSNCAVHVPEEERVYSCLIKGRVRIQGIRSTNPVVVGDWVHFTPDPQQEVTYIESIEPRRNYIIRRATNLSKESHILAANIDLALLMVTIARPRTSYTFIDRFLATAEAYRIPTEILINKVDDLKPDEEEVMHELTEIYTPLGYPCHPISALQHQGTDALLSLLDGKCTLIAGHSGTGKSTLLNSLIPDLELATQAISSLYETGQHTTTYSEMYQLPSPHSGWIIDTPGIKAFGTLEMSEEDTSHFFREFFAYSSDCRFANCTHLHEPGCAVLKALEEERIAPSRYKSYLSILQDEHSGPYRPEQ